MGIKYIKPLVSLGKKVKVLIVLICNQLYCEM